MADETILDKAVALIPGMGSSKSKKLTASQRHKQLQAIQKKLAMLAKDIEALADHVGEEVKEALGKGKPAGASSASRKAPSAKTSSARKPLAASKPGAGNSGASNSGAAKPAAAKKAAPAAKPAKTAGGKAAAASKPAASSKRKPAAAKAPKAG